MALIQYISRIQFDFGAVSLLAEEIARLGLKRTLLVTDKGVAAAGILDRVLDAAKPSQPVVYKGTTENPTEQSLLACLDLWAEQGCDGLIALGGGSPIDLSKAVALLASHGGNLADYNVKTGGSEKIGKVAPQIAIPTAAGTGAEIGRACVMSLLDGSKMVAVNLNMVADTIICDPELTLTLPASLTAATGIDAFSHGVEAAMSTMVNPPAEAIALDCVARAAKWLPVAVQDGQNRQARWEMMMAALEGGMCLQKGLGGAHAMGTPLGELHLHHGRLIGVLLPHIVRFNAEVAQAAQARIRTAAAVPDEMALEDWITDFTRSLGLPTTLGEMGVPTDILPQIATRAEADHLTLTNPRKPIMADYLKMLQSAM
tara:strand:- start:10919 stop:12034 length:1116 start_codon:yes stop_codon:yes gene_type:complete